MTRPQPLMPGDLIDVVAPASRCALSDVRAGAEVLESWGYRVRIPQRMYGPHPLFSNCDKMRLEHLTKALFSRESKAVWCVRGGYGSMRLLPELKKLKAPKAKIFIGMSDITSLNLFFQEHWGWPVYHGTMLASLAKTTSAVQKELRDFLSGDLTHITFKNLKAMNSKAKKSGVIRSEIVGGNLMTLQSSLGTPYALKASRKILFFEEVGERGYRVDRMLSHLQQAGALKNIKAILIGQMIGGAEATGQMVWKSVLADFAKASQVPVISDLPCGHGNFQRVLPLGARCELKLGAKPSLTVISGLGSN